MFIFIVALIVSFSSEGQSFFLGQNVPRAMRYSQSNSKLSLSSQDADSAARKMAIASSAAGSEEIDWFTKTPMACCADDMCFMEPPATETGTARNFSCSIYMFLVMKIICNVSRKTSNPLAHSNNLMIFLIFYFLLTFLGLTIRCLLSQNGLDVDWINPEDEEAVPKKNNAIITEFSDYDDEDEAEE